VSPRAEFPPVPKAIVAKVASACKDLPEVSIDEGPVWQAVRVRRRIFARLFSMRDPDDRVQTMLVLRADPDERRALLAIGHPYFRPGSGVDALGVVIEPATDWTELRELLTESYLILAPKKLASLVVTPEMG
jgi:hypothetical protein